MRAFTLVELAIVLVILGLLVGGVLAGRSLLTAAEIRNGIAGLSETEIALHTFREKYMGIPGDFSNATSFWPSQTTNGNGDGRIDFSPSDEYSKMYQQLSLAGLVPGSYQSTGTFEQTLRRVSAGVYIMTNWKVAAVYGVIGNNMRLFSGTGSSIFEEPPVAWQIDRKLDDGTPNAGRILTANDPGCLITAGANLEYELISNERVCTLRYYWAGGGRL